MKRRDLLTPAVNIILSALTGFAGVGCLLTAFELDASTGAVALCCLFWAAAAIISLRFKRGWLVLAGMALLWTGYLWRQDILEELRGLLLTLFRMYRQAYGWDIPHWLTGEAYSNVPLAMEAIASLCAIIAGISLARRRAAGAVVAALLPLLPCLVVTNTPPDGSFLFLTLLCIALTVLTQSVRFQDARQGSRLTAMLLVPVLLANMALFHENPQEGYEPPTGSSFIETMTALLNKLPFIHIDDSGNVQFGTVGEEVHYETVNLAAVGPKRLNQNVVMWVSASYSDFVYLRGRSYSSYDGTQWIADSKEETDLSIDPKYTDPTAQDVLSLSTQRTRDILYLPYYAQSYTSLEEGRVRNTTNLKDYDFRVHHLAPGWKGSWEDAHRTNITMDTLSAYLDGKGPYLQLPDHTAQQAQVLLDQILLYKSDSVITTAEKIAAYVRNSARYDLNTPHMPVGTPDFAIWFLTGSDTGYCVHFATATAVLLRAAGIPARYVEGYAGDVRADQVATVRESQAHAWVEYYVPLVGWVMLESTPSDFMNVEPPPTNTPVGPTIAVPSAPTRPSTAAPRPTTVPETTVPVIPPTAPSADPDPEKPVDLSWLWHALLILGCIAGALVLVIGQWKLRLELRRRNMYRGRHNDQALHRWRFVKQLAKLRRQEPPEFLHQLAKKAKFSQHTLSDAELQQFDSYFSRSIAHLKQRPWPLKLVYRLIFAAY